MNTARSHRHTDIARLRELARSPRARHAARRCVVEGPKLIAEAADAGLDIIQIIHAETKSAHRNQSGATPKTPSNSAKVSAEIISRLANSETQITVATQRAIERVATTKNPQPIIAEVAVEPAGWFTLDNIEAPAVLVAVDINDPGNLGTLIRSASANGFDAVITTGDTTDAYSPKVIRASAGTIFRTPVLNVDTQIMFSELAARNIQTVGTALENATVCDHLDLTGPIALLLGNEANGLDPNLELDMWTTIPMSQETESLNVAMAGTILSYELARQRRQKGQKGREDSRPSAPQHSSGSAQHSDVNL